MARHSIIKRYGFAWVTLTLFLVSLALHWLFGWFAYVDEELALGHPVQMAGYLHEMLRDTFENWQSEFLQLIWQVMGLALLLHVGSPQSKEGDDRMEAKLDLILRRVDPEKAEALIAEIDDMFEGRHTDEVYQEQRLERKYHR